MNLQELYKSLRLREPHICCDEAKWYLGVPRKGTDGPVRLDDSLGTINCRPIDTWHLDLGDGGAIIPVRFCPFCGEELVATT